ncbi:hypothetical protein [Streptomyces sp. NPDC059631]|uniref:hypothetical protein n=1 Tax=unclassified Streptomyces TaxID=2593676 RepID=UPI003674089F
MTNKTEEISMAKTQVEDRPIFLLSALLSAALPLARYVQRHGNTEDREKLRRLTGSREYEELSNILVQLRR